MGKNKRLAKKREKIDAKMVTRQRPTKSNPFEIQVSKKKYNVLGRKMRSDEVGRPFKSRMEGVVRRKGTLLNEYRNRNKSGAGLVDRRIKDAKGGISARRAKLQQLGSDGEEEIILTHEGEDIESLDIRKLKRDQMRGDDEGIDILKHGEYVQSAHFGGGKAGQPISSKEYLDEIAQEKMKRQQEREENMQLTNKLDNDWNSIRNLIKHKGSLGTDKNAAANEEYDVLLNQLIFGGDEKRVSFKDQPETTGREKKDIETSLNVQMCEHISTLIQSSSPDEIKQSFDFLVSCEVKRLNSSVIKLLVKCLRSKFVGKCSLKSISLLMFALSFREWQNFSLVHLVHFLNHVNYRNVNDVAKRIFLCKILIESSSKFFPEVIVSLRNLLVLFSQDDSVASSFVPSFIRQKLDDSDVYHFTDIPADSIRSELSMVEVFDKNLSQRKDIRFSLLLATLDLLKKTIETYNGFHAFEAIFLPFLPILDSIRKRFPLSTSQVVTNLQEKINESKEIKPLSFESTRPTMITMLEPRMEPLRKNRDSQKVLVKSYKREFKSAQRELRKDGAFLRDVVLKDTLSSDKIRKEKVKRLMSEIAEERSMFKKKR